MKIYYECSDCGCSYSFNALDGSDYPKEDCPDCGSSNVVVVDEREDGE